MGTSLLLSALALAFVPQNPFEVNGLSGDLAGIPRQLAISPDSSRVVYRADAASFNFIELFSARIDGRGEPLNLSALPPTGRVQEFWLDPTGSRVVYLADENVSGLIYDIYSVPVDGGAAPTRLTDDLVSFPLIDPILGPLSNTGAYGPTPTADGARVVFLARRSSDNTFLLYSAPVDGSEPMTPLSTGPTLDLLYRLPFAVSHDGTLVVYQAPIGGGSDVGLYSVPADGSAAPTLLSAHTGGHTSTVKDFEVAADDSFVVYRGDLESDEVEELFAHPLGGGGFQVKLNGTLVTGGDVDDTNDTFQQVNYAFTISPDGSRVVYSADQDVDGELELYSVPTDGSQASVKLNEPLVGALGNGGLFRPFRVAPDSSTVVYLAQQESSQRELFSVPIDGSEDPVRLHPPRSLQLSSYEIDATSSGVVIHWLSGGNNGELDYAALDGSLHVQDMTGTLQVTGFVSTQFHFRLTPDQRYVVFGARASFNAPRELFRVPIDGSEPPRSLSGPQISSGVSDFDVAPDGRYAAYRGADASHDDQLFSARVFRERPRHAGEAPRPE